MKDHCSTTNCRHKKKCRAINNFERYVKLYGTNSAIKRIHKEELAFYHAISKPENILDFYTNEELIEFTQELTKTITKEMTPDWMMRESGKENMRRAVKRLLSKYKYPKDQRDKIMSLIIEQTEYYDYRLKIK